MSDIQIAVGAQDQASKILQGVEKQTNQLARSVAQMSAQTVASTQRMEIAFKGLSAAAGIVTVIVGAVKAVGAVFDAGGAAMEAFTVQDAAVRGLTNALEMQGVEASKSIESHTAFAAALQNTINVGDEFTLGLMKSAANLDIADSQLQETAKAAIGLAEATGMSAEESLKKLNQALNGNAAAFAEVIPAMKDAKTEEEKLALVSELATRGLMQKSAATQSLQGSSERVSGAVGDLMEKFGELLAPIQTVINQGFAVLFETLQSAVEPAIVAVYAAMESLHPVIDAIIQAFRSFGVVVWSAVESVVAVVSTLTTSIVGNSDTVTNWGDTINGIVDWVAKAFIGFITGVEVGLTNMSSVLGFVADSAHLYLERMRADFEHAFTVAIPAYVMWFAAEWPKILTDAATAVQTIVTNLVNSIAGSFAAVQEFLSSDKSIGDIGKLMSTVAQATSGGLLEGFEATTSELPQVAARAATAVEKELTGRMNAVGMDLAAEFTAKYDERVARLGENAKEKIDNLQVDLGATIKGSGSGIESKLADLQATESRFLTRGRGDDPTTKVAENTAAMAAKLDTLPALIAKGIADVVPGLGKLLQVEVLTG